MEEDSLKRLTIKQLRRAPLALPLLGVVGCLLGGQWWVLVVLAVAMACLMKLHRILICLLLCTSIATVHDNVLDRNASLLHRQLTNGSSVELCGTIERKLAHGCILNTGLNGVRVVLRGDIPWHTGSDIRCTAIEQPVREALIEGMFDTGEWMESQGLAANLRMVHGEFKGYSVSYYTLLGFAESVRHHLVSNLMPPGTENDDRRQVLCALALGDKSKSEQPLLNIFKRGGCLHAFAVSGLHVGIVTGMLYALAYISGVNPRGRSILVLIIVGAYVLVTGLAVPALRAYLMISLALLGLELRRRVDPLNIWSLAALIILLLQPWQLRNAGFVLSFAVYAAIGIGISVCMKEGPWFAPDRYLPIREYSKWDDRLRSFDAALRGVIIVSLSAWLMSLPITAAFFRTITPYSFLTNIAIAPILPIVMSFGLLTALFGWIPLLGNVLNWLALQSSSLLIAVVQFFGSLPMAYLPVTQQVDANTAMVCHTGYDHSFVVLGNPGLIINPGDRTSVHFQTEPALFFGGFRPSSVLLTHSDKAALNACELLQESWSHLHIIHGDKMLRHQRMSTEAGTFDIYPAPRDISRQNEKNGAPIVRWKTPSDRSVLFIGHAASITYNTLPESEQSAHVIVLGYNPDFPIDILPFLENSRATECILLPGVPEEWKECKPTGVEMKIVDENAPLHIFHSP